MRFVLALLLAASCGQPARIVVVPPQQAVCPPPVVPKERGATAVALQQELDEIDQELDAIDNILIAAERTSGLSQLDAIEAAMRRQLQLRNLDLLAMTPAIGDEPLLMTRIRTRYLVKRADVERLGKELGQRHPEMVAATQRLDQLRADYDRQREIELGFAKAWQHELLGVPPARVPKDHVYASRMRALAPFFASSQIPSDAPSPILLAAIELAELRYRRDEEAAELGPKHPEMLALIARIGAAERALREAIDAPAAAVPATVVDGKLIARRAELAKRARILRADLRRD